MFRVRLDEMRRFISRCTPVTVTLTLRSRRERAGCAAGRRGGHRCGDRSRGAGGGGPRRRR